MRRKPARPQQSASKETRLRDRLVALANNLWWSWNTEACEMWDRVAAEVPASKRASLRSNPVAMVQSLKSSHLGRLVADRGFSSDLSAVEKAFRRYLAHPTPPEGLSATAPVAYFSMEFGLHESLPIYSGGLGILAGDHIKSASDAGVPLVGVTFFYRHGYFRQQIGSKGQHDVAYPKNDPAKLPLEPVVDREGRELRVNVELPGRSVSCRAWQLAVGRRTLYLLDTDVPENNRRDRAISHRLYDGDREMRMTQEVVLGIGGARLIAALGVRPGVWHLNEGHVVFLALERLRAVRDSSDLSVQEALEAIAADTVFTTHTPVPAGNETFDLPLAQRYLEHHCEAAGMPVADFLRLGLDHDGGRPILSLTVLALRLSRFRNGVSALHGEVSRDMWSRLWPGFESFESPISSVTNGIHVQTWVAPAFDRLFRQYIDEDWTEALGATGIWKRARKIPDKAIWNTKRALKEELIDFVRARTRERLERYGQSEQRVRRATENLLDPDALTIGFARRFATYKRANLLFRDIARAEKLFGSKKRPVQIIFAGKPHPADPEGRKLFERIETLSRRAGLRDRVVLIENYDTEVCRYMVRGVDVWLNNPRRPQEASGTSGQKVPVNCGLNLSILDGWWCEGFEKDTGFAFGKTKEYADADLQDREDHADLLRVIGREVLPKYFQCDGRGLPKEWLKMVKAGLEKLVYRFSTQHMVLDYAENLYAPAFENGAFVREAKWREARELCAWRESVERSWPLAHVRSVESKKGRGRKRQVEVEVWLAGISADCIACCDEEGDLVAVRGLRSSDDGACTLRLEVPEPASKSGKARSAAKRTLRLFPSHPSLVHPQEMGVSLSVEV